MVSLFYFEYIQASILIVFAIILASIILFLSYIVTIYNPDTEKVSAYECGFDPYNDARSLFDVRFYLVSMLFIIFDLEAVYFFPWCAALGVLPVEGYSILIDFLIELIVGYLYAFYIGAFEWE